LASVVRPARLVGYGVDRDGKAGAVLALIWKDRCQDGFAIHPESNTES
jgi:hypothetical protein